MAQSETDAILLQAERHLAGGALQEAEPLYRDILSREPGHPKASHGLALIALHTGHAAAAIELLQTASIGAPDDPGIHCHLGLAFATSRDFENAEACYRKSLALAPDFVDGHINLANLLLESGRIDDAAAAYVAALDLAPDNATAHYGSGLLALRQQRRGAAVAAFERAVELAPNLLPARINLANLHLHAGAHDDAVRHLQEAVAHDPTSFDARLNLCAALQQIDRAADAVEVARGALALAPDSPELLVNLASAEMNDGRPEEAWRTLDRAIGVAPDYAPARLNRAMARLLMGDMPDAWEDYESRPSKGVLPHPSVAAIAPWNGEDLVGKSILVWAEQGYGDVIQFARYLPLLAERGASVILDVPPPLASLFTGFAGVSDLVVRDRDEELPKTDYQLPILSLAGRLGTSLETIPSNIPYLGAPEGAVLPGDLPSDGKLIGLCWHGSKDNPNDHRRSVDPDPLVEALVRQDVELVGLQYGAEYSPIANPGGAVEDFAEMAALIARMDLVISVDTSVAHLAGALGKPVWVLIPFSPDWRWMTARSDSPWYPTMRLFRQPEPGDWDSVFRMLAIALDE